MYQSFETLHIGSKQLPYSMLNFWQVSLSDIVFNMNRGTFAEYIVRCALTEGGFDALSEGNGTINAFDISGPEIPSLNRQSKIEVKSTASVQKDTDYGVRTSLPESRLVFDIHKAIDWKQNPNISKRNNDLYVFCHYKAEYRDDDILDLNLWDFYVCPTYRIDNNPVLNGKNTVSIYRLRKIGIHPVPFDQLFSDIMQSIQEISDFYTEAKNTGI